MNKFWYNYKVFLLSLSRCLNHIQTPNYFQIFKNTTIEVGLDLETTSTGVPRLNNCATSAGFNCFSCFKFQALAVRRHQCENIDADPLVWTNQRFIKWARNIDLGEYAENLKGKIVAGQSSALLKFRRTRLTHWINLLVLRTQSLKDNKKMNDIWELILIRKSVVLLLVINVFKIRL